MRTIRTALAGGAAILLAPVLAGPAIASTTNPPLPVYRFADGSPIPHTRSTLSSDAGGVSYTFDTRELTKGHAYTLWLVVFNAPQNCSHGAGDGVRCGPGDLPLYGGDDSAQTSFLPADSHAAYAAPAMFRGTRATESTDGALWGPGIVNPTGAEIHLLLQDDGTGAFVQFSPHAQQAVL